MDMDVFNITASAEFDVGEHVVHYVPWSWWTALGFCWFKRETAEMDFLCYVSILHDQDSVKCWFNIGNSRFWEYITDTVHMSGKDGHAGNSALDLN